MTDVQTRPRELADLDADLANLRRQRHRHHDEHGAPVNNRIVHQIRHLLTSAHNRYGLPYPTIDASHTGDITVAWHVPPHGQAGGETDMHTGRLNLFAIDCTPGTATPPQFGSVSLNDPDAAELLTRFVAAV